MEHVEHEESLGDFTLKILPDEDGESPREWDNLGTMVCFHRRYSLGDPHTLDRETARLIAESEPSRRGNPARKRHGGNFVLPLYLYDHSGLTMNTGGFSCPWDSGQVGWIWCSYRRARAEFGWSLSIAELSDRVYKVLRGEVATYAQYLEGDVHGYVVEDGEGEIVDSCWGFYGLDEAISEGREALRRAVDDAQETERALALANSTMGAGI